MKWNKSVNDEYVLMIYSIYYGIKKKNCTFVIPINRTDARALRGGGGGGGLHWQAPELLELQKSRECC